MRSALFKYLLVFVCLFSVLERAGIVNALVTAMAAKHQQQYPAPADGEDDDARPNETKEVELKEYWAITGSQYILPVLSVGSSSWHHPHQCGHHLGWIPPVPTPPPNHV
ncbi:hypothetical protein [Mucilaginibacter pedocola]|uniref:Uncharacterized protein n=1 Tax=Mucilaginibacter pedocola TaxID=1792845 RepID=A0A1S9PAN9_9SPHI|nr:hypothetical protein [Mucilaginibacter pedocola]OOQ58046.1 hypothetical protein BC343_10310 [Mucilaginibacter pedocola]